MNRRFSFLNQTLSEDVSCQQILFLSADFVSRFLLSADFVFVSRFRQKIFFVSRFVFRQQMSLHLSTKRRSRRHIHFHASLFREGNIFSSGGRAFSLQSRLHSFCRNFQYRSAGTPRGCGTLTHVSVLFTQFYYQRSQYSGTSRWLGLEGPAIRGKS